MKNRHLIEDLGRNGVGVQMDDKKRLGQSNRRVESGMNSEGKKKNL